MKAIYLNLESRTDRKRRAEKNFKEVGLTVERFPAVVHESPHHSFIQSQKAILQSITENTIVFEDDVQFMNMAKWDKVIESIPEDFDLAYLGGNPQRELTNKVNEYWWRALDIWTTHAVIYSKKGAEKILTMFEDDEMYDNWLGRLGLYQLNGYICKPFLCTQYPSYSDIWERNVDYTSIFENGQNKLV
jgi:hypothetical protein